MVEDKWHSTDRPIAGAPKNLLNFVSHIALKLAGER